MSGAALGLALAAALVHAVWNTLLAGSENPRPASAIGWLSGVVLFAPFAALTWDLDAQALPYIAGSAVFQLTYIALLTRAYERAELSFVYPVARGSAPVIVLMASAVALSVAPSAPEVAGVLGVAVGILLLRGTGPPAKRAALWLALGVGASIAGYTVLDSEGIDHGEPLSYLAVQMAITGVFWGAWVAATHGGSELRAAFGARTVAMGAGMFGAYVLVLAALQRADPAPVAAVRETSIVMAAALGALFLGEHVPARRWLGALVVAAGVAVLAAG